MQKPHKAAARQHVPDSKLSCLPESNSQTQFAENPLAYHTTLRARRTHGARTAHTRTRDCCGLQRQRTLPEERRGDVPVAARAELAAPNECADAAAACGAWNTAGAAWAGWLWPRVTRSYWPNRDIMASSSPRKRRRYL